MDILYRGKYFFKKMRSVLPNLVLWPRVITLWIAGVVRPVRQMKGRM